MQIGPSTKDPPWGSSFYDRTVMNRIDADQVLSALADDSRREILGYLDMEPVWTRERLATRLVQSESTNVGGSVDAVELSLVHLHLPVLEEANLVDLDEGGAIITRGRDYEVIRAMMDAATATMAEVDERE